MAQLDQRSITAQLNQQTKSIDLKIIALWQTMPTLNACSLIAVGGYGRGEMFPYSDVDLLIVHGEQPIETYAKDLEQFVTLLWDLGVSIGHSVRSLQDCMAEAANDITVQTAMLEARFLAGDHALFAHMQTQFFAQINPARFLQAKVLEMQQRHQRYENTPYSLEPNCKESPGGLRDLHILIWVAKAAGLGQSWKALEKHGILSNTEYRSLRKAERMLQTIRFTLHQLSKRREDRLVFDLQAQAAQSLGYVAKPGRRASEVMMQKYYLAAKAISQLNGLLLQALERAILGEASYQQHPLTAEFCEQNGFLHALDRTLFEREPVHIFTAFHLLAQYPHLRDLSADTQRAIWNARDELAKVRHTQAYKDSFMLFFKRGTGLTRIFRRMNALGVLGRALPAFRRIVGQMQHDLFHVYTVDQHILTVVRNMRRFAMPQHVHEYPLCSQLMAGFDDQYVLYVAALFHDIAKGRGGDHSDLGQHDMARFGRTMGMPLKDIDLAVFLVKQHLIMSTVAQKSDVSDPDTIAKFANLVGTEQRLTALYLLTVADIRGTSPKVWNAWKGKLLESLYTQTLRYLQDNQRNPIAIAHPTEHSRDAVRALLSPGVDPSALWNDLDDAYFLRNQAIDAAWHTQTLLPKLNQPVVVTSRLAPDGTGLQVLVYSSDQPELFARICSCFDALGLAVLDAQVHTTRKGQALDHFVLQLPLDLNHDLSPMDATLVKIEHTLQASLTKESALPAPRSARLPRQVRHFAFAPQCHITPDEKGAGYLLELQAVDQASLLYRIALVFAQHKINVHTARITTLGGRAIDFFLLTGDVLNSPKQQLQFEADLISAVSV